MSWLWVSFVASCLLATAHAVSQTREVKPPSISKQPSPNAWRTVKPITSQDLEVSQSRAKIFVKFKNLSKRRLGVFELRDGGEQKIGSLASGDTSSMALLDNHRLVSRVAGEEEEGVEDVFTITAGQSFYGLGQSSSNLCPELKLEFDEEVAYIADYERKTGQPWRAHYGFYLPNLGPRPPPSIARSQLPVDYQGQQHACHSREGYWLDDEGTRERAPLDMQVEVLCTSPKVYSIRNFLSDFEADELILLGKTVGSLQPSVVGSEALGGNVRDTRQRSSQNAWLSPNDSPVVRSVYLRAADLLDVEPEAMLKATEPMQLVYYQKGQQYQSHFDWEVRGKVPRSRYATILLYLNDQASGSAGGETAFPRAVMANGETGFKIHPGKRHAVLFYNLLDDGNGDLNSLHAALPVSEGEKWAANLWVWG